MYMGCHTLRLYRNFRLEFLKPSTIEILDPNKEHVRFKQTFLSKYVKVPVLLVLVVIAVTAVRAPGVVPFFSR